MFEYHHTTTSDVSAGEGKSERKRVLPGESVTTDVAGQQKSVPATSDQSLTNSKEGTAASLLSRSRSLEPGYRRSLFRR